MADDPKQFQLVGECYLHGIMDGQALRKEYGPAIRRKGKHAEQPRKDVAPPDIWEEVILV
jgi:hypothetical protein